jgi:hypothetical protein
LWIQGGLHRLQFQDLLQHGRDVPGKADCPPGLTLGHFLQVVQQVGQAFLLEPGLQTPVIIGYKAIRNQDAFELFAQDLDHHIAAAVIPDSVDGCSMIGEDPQPGRQCVVPPTRFIGVHFTALPDHFDQLLIHSPGGLGQTLICLATATPTHVQSIRIVEYFGHFAVRTPQAVLQIRRQGFCPWPHHHCSHPRPLRNLLRMLRMPPLFAVGAVAAEGHIAGDEGMRDRYILHKLLTSVNIPQLAPTLRTAAQSGDFCLI